jgi:hypothetical protein
MIGDCDNCGHSAMYHVPLMGCIKCDCDEFVIRLARAIRRWLRNRK